MDLLIVDDHPLIRSSLVSVLLMEKDVEQIYEAANVDEALKILRRNNIDISMIDIRLGNGDGFQIISISKSENIKSKFIVLTSSPEYKDFLKAVKLGVDGYLLKKAFAEDISYALHIVERGKKYFDPEIVEYKFKNTENRGFMELTKREKEVLVEVGKGFSNIEISKNLFISENTVKKHISSILCKLGLSHRTEAAIFINKLINLDDKF